MEEQQELQTSLKSLCESCLNRPCSHLIEQRKKYGEDPIVSKCKGYKEK